MDVAKKYQDALPRIKKNVENAHQYFRDNYNRYHEFRKFIFQTNLNETDKTLLATLQKPVLEFNVLEAYISRLRGEFSKQEPSLYVMPGDEAEIDEAVIKTVQGHLKHITNEADKNGFSYDVYTDMLSGGFSVMKVWTEYANDMSFNQVIRLGRAYDPTLCGFDPLARNPTKNDGRFCFEFYPKTKEEFKEEFSKIDISSIKFTRNPGDFNWSYMNDTEEVLLICDFYERKRKRTGIVQLSDNQVMTKADYKMFLETWENMGFFEQPPQVVKERMTDIEYICRYRFIENQVLEYNETNFRQLPLIFADGNSVLIKDGEKGAVKQMTRPYIYQARDTQRLKNFSGQTWANDIENRVMHKWKVAKEGIPQEEQYIDAYTNPQQANVLVYNAFKDDDPNVPVPPPQEIQHSPIPQEIVMAFTQADQQIQSILGSYDASLGINNNQLSGVAIVEGATQSNAAAMPYIVGYLQALSQFAEIGVDLIPKYFVTPRTIPVVGIDGKLKYQKINQPGGVSVNYDENALNVRVEAGVNFQIQKSRDLQMMIELMRVSPLFAQFMNEEGLEELLDNFDVQNRDVLKDKAIKWEEKLKQKQEAAQQAAQNQPNPAMLKLQLEQQSLAIKSQEAQTTAQLKAAQIAVEKQQADTDQLKVLATIGESRDNVLIAHDKAQAEKTRAAVDLAIKEADMHHRHAKETIELHHKIKGESENAQA